MRMLIFFVSCVFVYTGCTSALYQAEQSTGEGAIADYEAARGKYDPEKIANEIKGQLTGRWQFIGIEIADEDVNAQMAGSTPESAETESTSNAETTTASPDTSGLVREGERVQLAPIIAEEYEDNQRLAAAKVALVAANRKNLTLEFYEDRSTYYYRGSNRGRRVTGQCKIITPRVGDTPLPFIRFRGRTGPKMREFLFSSESERLVSARRKQAYAENMQRVEGRNYVNTNQPIWWDKHENIRRLGGQGSENAAPKGVAYMPTSALGIEVTADRLYIILQGDIQLTPNGWIRTGGLRCAFKRME